MIGYVGLLSFGHALYFGWASYLAAHAAKVWGFPPELAILTGTLTGCALGIIAGSLAIRRQGIYFAMITLALAQMMYFFAVQAPFTGGEDGIQAVPRGRLLGIFDLSNQMTMYFFVLAVFLACFLLIYRIIHSPFGEVLKAIREVGGLGTVFGPVVGALTIIAMENYLAQTGQWVTVIQGVVFVVVVLLFRRGIVGELANALKIPL